MYLVVGCGLSGIVIAERIANILKKEVLIIEKLDHIGGNCYDYIDKETNILVNKYGAHLFHTNNKEVWDYINQFDKWVRWEHNVLSYVDDKYVPMPINITTVNMLCNENIETTDEMKKWLNNNQIKYDNIDNSEKMAKSRVGNILYDKLTSLYIIIIIIKCKNLICSIKNNYCKCFFKLIILNYIIFNLLVISLSILYGCHKHL